MLFDTTSPSRKRFVQITFALLALLMGGGLVLFGIGSNTGDGGIINPNNPGSSSILDIAKDDADDAQKALEANPKDEAAAAKLAKARLSIAQQAAIDPTTGQLLNEDQEEAQSLLAAADQAWTKYLALGPAKPDGSAAIQYSQFYALPANSKYDKASRALEAALVTRKPNTGLYGQLAVYALASGNDDKYKSARAKALELAGTAERRTAVAKQLDDVKKQVDESRKAQAEAQAGATGEEADGTKRTTPLPTLPSLQ